MLLRVLHTLTIIEAWLLLSTLLLIKEEAKVRHAPSGSPVTKCCKLYFVRAVGFKAIRQHYNYHKCVLKVQASLKVIS